MRNRLRGILALGAGRLGSLGAVALVIRWAWGMAEKAQVVEWLLQRFGWTDIPDFLSDPNIRQVTALPPWVLTLTVAFVSLCLLLYANWQYDQRLEDSIEITPASIEKELVALGYPKSEASQVAVKCSRALRTRAIRTQGSARAFFRDIKIRSALEQIYRDTLGRAPESREGAPLVDAWGLCTWGPAIFLAPKAERGSAISDVTEIVRALRDEEGAV